MDSKKWLARVGSGASVNAMAEKIGIATSTLDSQMKSPTGLKPETMVALAREYGYSPVAALVDRGVVTSLEARASAGIERDLTVPQALAEASDDQLLQEIGRRLDERGDDGTGSVKPIRGPRPSSDTSARKSSTGTVQKKAARKDKAPDA